MEQNWEWTFGELAWDEELEIRHGIESYRHFSWWDKLEIQVDIPLYYQSLICQSTCVILPVKFVSRSAHG
jgi:hypothetical protein